MLRADEHTTELLKLADLLEGLVPGSFSMTSWGQWSEPRCICGWYLHSQGFFSHDDWREAAKRLGLSEETAKELFSAENHWDQWQAARAVRYVAVTGSLVGFRTEAIAA